MKQPGSRSGNACMSVLGKESGWIPGTRPGCMERHKFKVNDQTKPECGSSFVSGIKLLSKGSVKENARTKRCGGGGCSTKAWRLAGQDVDEGSCLARAWAARK